MRHGVLAEHTWQIRDLLVRPATEVDHTSISAAKCAWTTSGTHMRDSKTDT